MHFIIALILGTSSHAAAAPVAGLPDSIQFAQSDSDDSSDSDVVDSAKPENLPQKIEMAGRFGIGAQAGFQSGATLAYWMNESHALNAIFTMEHGNFVAGLAHLWMFRTAFVGDVNPMVPYIGVGVLGAFGKNADEILRDGSKSAAVVTLPLGCEYLFEHFGIFLEISPGVEISKNAPDVFSGDGGARFYF